MGSFIIIKICIGLSFILKTTLYAYYKKDMIMKKLMTALLLIPITLYGLSSNEKGTYNKALDDAKNAADALSIITKIATKDEKRTPLDYAWFTSTAKDKAKAKGVTEAQFWGAFDMPTPGVVAPGPLKDAIAGVKSAADAVQAALMARLGSDTARLNGKWSIEYFAALNEINDAFGTLLRATNMKPGTAKDTPTQN